MKKSITKERNIHMSTLTNRSLTYPTSIELLGLVSPPQERENVDVLTQLAQGKLNDLEQANHSRNENNLQINSSKVRRFKHLTESCGYLAVLSFVADRTVDFLTNVLQIENDDAVRYIAATSSAIAITLGICTLAIWYRQRESEEMLDDIKRLIEQDEKAPEKIRKLLLALEELQEQEMEDSLPQEDHQEALVGQCLEAISHLPERIFERTLPSRQIFLNAVLSLSKWVEISSILAAFSVGGRDDIESQYEEKTTTQQESIHFEDKGQTASRMQAISFKEQISSIEAWERLGQKLYGYGLSLPDELCLKDKEGHVHTIENPLREDSKMPYSPLNDP